MDNHLDRVNRALAEGHIQQAKTLLKRILQNDPSADAYVLAAKLTTNTETSLKLLRKALELDSWHSEANRLLHERDNVTLQKPESEWDRQTGMKPLPEINRQGQKLAYQKRKQRHRTWTRLGCVFSILLSFSLSIFAFRAIGWLSPHMTGVLSMLTGGSPPVFEIEGTPIELVEDAPLIITPAMVKEAAPEGMEVMDAGYLHEHQFYGSRGQEYAIYVQFLSEHAQRVSRNVVILNPFDEDSTALCEQDTILRGDNGITFICVLNASGTWKVRVLGRENESVGAYFIGVQKFDLDF